MDNYLIRDQVVKQSLSESVQTRLYQFGDSSISEKQYNLSPSILGEMLLKLRDISQLSEGWDGEGADRIAPDVINRTKRILELSRYPLFVSPTARGSVQIEYSTRGRYVEMEISSRDVEVFAVHGENEYIAEGKESSKIEFFFNFINNE